MIIFIFKEEIRHLYIDIFEPEEVVVAQVY